MDSDKAMAEWQKAVKTSQQDFNRAAKEMHRFFEIEDSPALPLWKEIVKDALNAGLAFHESAIKLAPTTHFNSYAPVTDLGAALEPIAREVAKLDGFDLTLRSIAVDQVSELKSPKHWVIPVRSWASNTEWRSEDGQLIGSHDTNGVVRPTFVQAMIAAGLYDEKGALKVGLLDPDCIEARDWNLSAGQYKPFDFAQLKSTKTVAQLISDLKTTEQQIISELDKLMSMVEGQE
jgi:type I restriction enzyme M protein